MCSLSTIVSLFFGLSICRVENMKFASIKPHVPHQKPDGRIIGGNEITPHSAPFTVGLIINGNAFCSGSLISENYVLTAAYCGSVSHLVEVILGAHNVTQNETSQQRLFSSDIIVHEDYDTTVYKNDISLIRLPINVSMNKYIQTARLPTRSDVDRSYVGKQARALGWGITHDKRNPGIHDISDVLRYEDSAVIDNNACSQYYNDPGMDYVNENNFCTSGYKNKATCHGDSGAPLIVDGVLVGVSSFGADLCETCTPSVYTNVAKFLDWIEAHTKVSTL